MHRSHHLVAARRAALLAAAVLSSAATPSGSAPREPLREPALGLPPWAELVPRAAPLLGPPAPALLPAQAGIEELVVRVVPESLDATVLKLSGYPTRRADTQECHAAAAWLAQRLAAAGADSIFVHSWDYSSAPNVIAIWRGTLRPREIYLVGGHYDSITRSGDQAPGADDNASGTALVLECARVLAGVRFEATVQFACFNAEEYGLLGSAAYANHLVAQGDSIAGMLNADMIGHLELGDRRDLDLVDGARAPWLRQVVLDAGARYVPELPIVDGSYRPNAGSDHFSFLARGWPAIALFEDTEGYSPLIHTAADTYGDSYNDSQLAALTTRVAVATLATLAVPIAVPVLAQDLTARTAGGRVELAWRLPPAAVSSVLGVEVERATYEAGPFESLTPVPRPPAPQMRFEDAAPPSAPFVWYRLVLHLQDGARTVAGPLAVATTPQAGSVALLAVASEPGGGPVQISYTLGAPAAGLRLGVYDLRGRLVRDLVTGTGQAGAHLCTWDRRDAAGARIARGLYFVRLVAGPARASAKLVLVHD